GGGARGGRGWGGGVVGLPRPRRRLPGFDAFYHRAEIAAAARELDFLVLLIPLDADTRAIVDEKVIAAMKPTSYLINLAHGGIVDEAALMAALRERRIAGAAMDTFEQEPLRPDSPWWRMTNTIVTPHLAGTYDRYAADAFLQFDGNLAFFLTGRPELMANRER